MNKIILLTISSMILPATLLATSPKGIYGADNRSEPAYSSNPKIRQYAKATAAMVNSKILRFIPDLNSYIFPTTTLGEDKNLCSDQNFYQQSHISSCTGFLVSKDILITAGHCVEIEQDCKDYRWVFDYTNTSTLLNKKDVYKCKKIINRKKTDNFFAFRDYTILQLEREVTDREPLKVRTKGRVKKETPLVMLGYPSGLPIKYDDSATVARHWNKFEKENFSARIKTFFQRASYFTANLDAFQGNSGSPVINLNTGEVEGLLVLGAGDYTYDFDRMCGLVQNHKHTDSEAQEVVFKITKIKELKALLK